MTLLDNQHTSKGYFHESKAMQIKWNQNNCRVIGLVCLHKYDVKFYLPCIGFEKVNS